jgi:hypothetical protein
VRIDGAPVATALRLVASAPPASTPTCTRTAFRGDLYRRLSACASICRRCAIGPTTCRRSRRGCWKTRARADGAAPAASRRPRWRCSAR